MSQQERSGPGPGSSSDLETTAGLAAAAQAYRLELESQITSQDREKTLYAPFEAAYADGYLDLPEAEFLHEPGCLPNPPPSPHQPIITPLPPTMPSGGVFCEKQTVHPLFLTNFPSNSSRTLVMNDSIPNIPDDVHEDIYNGPHAPLNHDDAQKLCATSGARLAAFDACPLRFCHVLDAKHNTFSSVGPGNKCTGLASSVWLFFDARHATDESAAAEAFAREGFVPLVDYFEENKPPAFTSSPAFLSRLAQWYVNPCAFEEFPHTTAMMTVASAGKASHPQTIAMALYLLLFAQLGDDEVSIHPLAAYHPRAVQKGRIFLVPRTLDQLCRLWTWPVCLFEEVALSFAGWPSKFFMDIDGILYSAGNSSIQHGNLMPSEEEGRTVCYLRGSDFNRYLTYVEEDICEALEHVLGQFLPWGRVFEGKKESPTFSLETESDQSQIRVLAGHRFCPGAQRTNFRIKVSLHVCVTPKHPVTGVSVFLASTILQGPVIARAVSNYLAQTKKWILSDTKVSLCQAIDDGVYNEKHCLRSVASPRVLEKGEILDKFTATTPLYPFATFGADAVKEAWHSPENWISAMTPKELHTCLFYNTGHSDEEIVKAHMHGRVIVADEEDDDARGLNSSSRHSRTRAGKLRSSRECAEKYKTAVSEWFDKLTIGGEERTRVLIRQEREKLVTACLNLYKMVCEENRNCYGYAYSFGSPSLIVKFQRCEPCQEDRLVEEDDGGGGGGGMVCNCSNAYEEISISIDEYGRPSKHCSHCNQTLRYFDYY